MLEAYLYYQVARIQIILPKNMPDLRYTCRPNVMEDGVYLRMSGARDCISAWITNQVISMYGLWCVSGRCFCETFIGNAIETISIIITFHDAQLDNRLRVRVDQAAFVHGRVARKFVLSLPEPTL